MNGLSSAIVVVLIMSFIVRVSSKNKRTKKNQENRRSENPNIRYSKRRSQDEDVARYGDEPSRQSLNEKIANAAIGIKYTEGDSLPEGHGVAKCAYCGAENLIVKNHRGRYICYFCKEIL